MQVLILEPCRWASGYAKPPSVLLKLAWMDEHLDCQAGSLIPNLDPTVLPFTCVAGLAQSLAIHINPSLLKVTPAIGQVMDT